MTSDWIAKGVVMPRSASAPTTGCDRPRSAKDCWDIWYSSAALRAAANDSGGCWLNPNRPDGGTQERTNLTGSRMPPVRRTLAATHARDRVGLNDRWRATTGWSGSSAPRVGTREWAGRTGEDVAGRARPRVGHRAQRPRGDDGRAPERPPERTDAELDDSALFSTATACARLEKLGHANILVIGQTGVGKSTLINADLPQAAGHDRHRQAGDQGHPALRGPRRAR